MYQFRVYLVFRNCVMCTLRFCCMRIYALHIVFKSSSIVPYTRVLLPLCSIHNILYNKRFEMYHISIAQCNEIAVGVG